MQSPFEIFRNKTLITILFGMAILAFVLGGAINDPNNAPPALIAVFMACVLGGVAWVAGIRKKKSGEWGVMGVIAGLILGVGATFAARPGDVVLADTGNISTQEMNMLSRQRSIANGFANMAYQRARENGAQMFREPPRFGFGYPDPNKDLVVGELLRREADRMGMQVTDEAVNDYIRAVSEGKVGPTDVREIRNTLGVSETGLYESLKAELKAYTMARFLYGGNTLPPVAYWDFYRKLNIQETVGVVPIPVQAFLDTTARPSDVDLQKLFADHKANYPNFTAEGRLDEGVPGFHQPRKVALEYLEIPFESVEKSIGEISDAEVEAFYEENYKSGPALNPPADGDAAASDDAPMLPELESDAAPASEPAGDEKPADEKPAAEKPETTPPTEGDPPAEEKPAAPEAAPADSKPETPAQDDAEAPAAAAETPPADAPAEEATETPDEAKNGESGALLSGSRSVQLVAFFDDKAPSEETEEPAAADPAPAEEAPAAEPAEEKPAADPAPPAEEKPAEEKPADEKPAEEKPAEDPPAETKPDAPPEETPDQPATTDAPAADAAPDAPATPPAEPNKPRVLDDDLRAEIRDQILRRKTAERQHELMTKTAEFMEELFFKVTLPEGDASRMTPEQTTDKLKAYAQEHGLVYEHTPLLSQRELSRSEEYPIGKAASATNFQSPSSVAQMAFNSTPTDLFRPEQVLDIESGSRFVFWKVEDVPAFVPESLDAPGIREQVVSTWRQLQAREKAKARAEELAKQAQGVEKPLSEVFADTTVTGAPADEGQSLTVVHPPRFSWLSAANAQMSPNPFNRPAPTLTELRTVPGDVGEQFMETVFNELQPGEVGVAHSFDLEYYYVVRVDDRTYGPSTDMQAFRERFTMQPVFDQFGFSDYSKLAARELGQYQTNWANELFDRHKVDFSGLDTKQTAEDDAES